jgi:segregation and condensation protein B
VITYKQPVTAPEVNEIRGVESGGVLGSLLSRKLIATAGRKQVIGRPILYKTTKEFLLRFGLKDVSELPSMEEFEKMAAVELSDAPDEPETPEQAAAAEGGLPPGSGPELDEAAPEDGTVEEAQAVTASAETSISELEPELELGRPANEARELPVPESSDGSELVQDHIEKAPEAETEPAIAEETTASEPETIAAENAPTEAESGLEPEEGLEPPEADASAEQSVAEAEPAFAEARSTLESEAAIAESDQAELQASKEEAVEPAPHD